MCQKNSVWFLCALFFMLSNVNIATSSKQALFNWKRKHEHTHTLTHSHFVKVNVYQEPSEKCHRTGEGMMENKARTMQTPTIIRMNEWTKKSSFWCFPISWTILHHSKNIVYIHHVSFMCLQSPWLFFCSVQFSVLFAWNSTDEKNRVRFFFSPLLHSL